MPELPEVETTLRGVEPYLSGSRVDAVTIRNGRLRWPVPEALPTLLVGKAVKAVTRRAKYLLVAFDGGSVLIHLGMSGSLRIVDADEPVKKHDHVDFSLSNHKVLRFNDPRRFGSILWQEAGQTHDRLLNLGPEPLTDEFDAPTLYEAAKRSGRPIKLLIMDNKVVVGVGNIYANEALFNAGIRPDRKASLVSKVGVERLVSEIKVVLARAIEQGGTTLKDFVGGDGKPGYFQQTLNVYGRKGEPCVVCSQPLKEIRMSQRATFFCSTCQR